MIPTLASPIPQVPPAHQLPGPVPAGDVALWVDQRGQGPDVLLLAGLGDPIEAWTFQLDGLAGGHRLTAVDNRGVGRSPMIPEGFTVADMAEDAGGLLGALGIEQAHVMGFSGGSAIAQELAIRHPELVRSLVLVGTWGRPDPYLTAQFRAFEQLVEHAPSDRAMLEAFFLWVYSPRAHADGTVAAVLEEALAFEHPLATEGFLRQLRALLAHDALDRLPSISVPTLVVAGGRDVLTRPEMGTAVADAIPGAELVVLPDEAHQPFQEQPAAFNSMVADFWRRAA